MSLNRDLIGSIILGTMAAVHDPAEHRDRWLRKPLLRDIYQSFHQRIRSHIDFTLPGPVLELGSGAGGLRSEVPRTLQSDLTMHHWLDLVCDGYELPFATQTLSNIVLFDVFHHLRRPFALLSEARRALQPGGRLLIFEPYVSLTTALVYGLAHHEPLALRSLVETSAAAPADRGYHAAIAAATRVFFGGDFAADLGGWDLIHAEAFSSFAYLLSGGYSRPSLYPRRAAPLLHSLDAWLTRWPRLFGARCLVVVRAR